MRSTIVNRQEDAGVERRTYLPPTVLRTLPERLISELYSGRLPEHIEEIRLHAGRCASVVAGGRNILLRTVLSATEMTATLTRMCGGSLYTHAPTIAEGYLTLDGGVRVGVCGRAACEQGEVIGVYDVSGLCIRIPAHFAVSGREICNLMQKFRYTKGVLIYSPPGVGKTTLLRGVACALASGENPLRVVVIDTRGEMPFLQTGASLCLDVLVGYPRRLGVEIACRTMNAQVMICDEIGDYNEALALASVQNCGVPLVASAHASSVKELLCRTGLRLLHDCRMFGAYVGIERAGDGFSYHITDWESADACI